MIYISFENELGKINLNGGVWRIKDIEGLGLLEKTVNIVTYPDTDGQELLSAVTSSRDITLSGDVLRRGEVKNELSKAMRILNKSGTLKLYIGSKKRKIKARCNLFSAGTKERNAVFQSFVMQLTCDYPYFEDLEEEKISLFLREDLIKDSFELPSIFTKRISRVNVVNSGDADTYPRVFIVCEKAQAGEFSGIELINHTTKQRFLLQYQMKEGEEICIDFEKRLISSNFKSEENNFGNLIIYMSDDSYLSDFYFASGINDVEFINHSTDSRISAFCQYSNKYVEAVI